MNKFLPNVKFAAFFKIVEKLRALISQKRSVLIKERREKKQQMALELERPEIRQVALRQ